MSARRTLDLSTFDGRVMDGLAFCKKVYDMYDQIRSEPDGSSKIRMRSTKKEKRLAEELIGIARYIQCRYAVDRRLKVRWEAGSQPYDAVVFASGPLAEYGLIKRRIYLEVTLAVHENEHLVRELVNSGVPSFGPKGTTRDRKTKQIISNAHTRDENEIANDLASQIVARLKSKAEKPYPENTVLIIQCIPNSVMLPQEWNPAIKQVNDATIPHPFLEVFVCCGHLNQSATLRRLKRSTTPV
jgi:hypothetical protein